MPADADPPTEVEPSGEAAADLPADADPPTEVEPSGEAVADLPADADPPTEVEPSGEALTAGEDAAPADADPSAVADAPAETEPPDERPTGDDNPAPADADPPTAPVDEAVDELPELTDTELECILEALLLTVDSPVEAEALADATGTAVARVNDVLQRMADAYTEHERGFDLRHAGGGWRYYTRDRYAPHVEKLLLGGQRAKLTRAALETLAVIAYRQPVTRARVAAVRGVNCDGVIRTLLARGLVEETGTDTETGGFLYRTTELFLERLGLSSLDDLPPIAPLLPEVDSIDDI
ncbi:SMC-Scp complex subunit ScpB [Actinophytocola sp. S1-96]|uniref:SMC-Scp complex subunit ScpB n=1 Tax=Actinophytocola gossypii TaxID=2812003 RepID=A0ABT2JIJ4_9PSEU|nr:SMC-Scp complex subunit ScpB [Actinophytocola gossypii]MCT2587611.1 SMC-Scp complex subunit ScpB [Actinophytocola gossypii]